MTLDETFHALQDQTRLISTQLRHSIPAPLQAYFETHFSSLPQSLNHIMLLMMLSNIFFFLGSCGVYHLPNVGGTTVLVSLASCAHNAALWGSFNDPDHRRFHLSHSEYTVGVFTGLCAGMSMAFFILCRYYGQFMKCEIVPDMIIKQYVCESKGSMWTVWFFGSILMMLNLALLLLIKTGRHDLVNEGGGTYGGTGGVGSGGGYQDIGGDERFEGDFPMQMQTPPIVSTQTHHQAGATIATLSV